MKRHLIAFSALVILILAGCKHEGAISPQERVVTNPDATDFGLCGTWRAVSDHALELNLTEPLRITMGDDGVYAVEWSIAGAPVVSLRATTLGNDSNSAVVDVEASFAENLAARYLAVAKREGDELHVWWIEAKNLAQTMHENGYSAVIEHEALATKVFADSDQLLDCVREHARELIGQRTVLELVTEQD